MSEFSFEVSREDKVLYPHDQITKGDIIDYYRRVSEYMLPLIKDRPLTMHRYPDGIDSEDFFQKTVPDYFPDWIERTSVGKNEKYTQVVAQREDDLAYLANQACLTVHMWLSRQDKPASPDRMVFDIDPPGDHFSPVRKASRIILDHCRRHNLPVYCMLTGSRGVHLVIPLKRDSDFDTVRNVASDFADKLAEQHPDQLTTEQRKNKRGGRVYLDVSRNAYGQTTVAPYTLRAKPHAPVATPIDPDELTQQGMHSQRYTISNLFRRLSQRSDPWRRMYQSAVSITTVQKAME
ncbi:ATP-dependent DNA ligase [candidate division GN15 bacterium]|nr:ATP-dependent DNA ligase [candidate division GN15 bacterium]